MALWVNRVVKGRVWVMGCSGQMVAGVVGCKGEDGLVGE